MIYFSLNKSYTYIHIYKANVYWDFSKGDYESYGYKIWISAYHECADLYTVNGIEYLLQYKDAFAESQGCKGITFKEKGKFVLYSTEMYSPDWDVFINCMDFGDNEDDEEKREIYLKINTNIFDNDNNTFFALK